MTIIDKILSGKELTEDEVNEIVFGIADIEIVDKIIEERHRWTILETIVFKIYERYFQIYYYSAATEYQADEFPEQIAMEVEKIPVTKYVWKIKNK